MFAVRSIQVEGASPALAAEVRAELRSFDGRSLVAVNGQGHGSNEPSLTFTLHLGGP